MASAPRAQQLPHRLRQRPQIGAQIRDAFLPSGRDFFKNTKQLHINRPQAHPAFGIHARAVAPRSVGRGMLISLLPVVAVAPLIGVAVPLLALLSRLLDAATLRAIDLPVAGYTIEIFYP